MGKMNLFILLLSSASQILLVMLWQYQQKIGTPRQEKSAKERERASCARSEEQPRLVDINRLWGKLGHWLWSNQPFQIYLSRGISLIRVQKTLRVNWTNHAGYGFSLLVRSMLNHLLSATQRLGYPLLIKIKEFFCPKNSSKASFLCQKIAFLLTR